MPTYINNKNEIYNNLPNKYININIDNNSKNNIDLLIFTVEDTLIKCDKNIMDRARKEEAKALLKKDFNYYDTYINSIFDTMYRNNNTVVLNCDYDYAISNRTYKELSFFKFKSLIANNYTKDNFINFIDDVTLTYSNKIKYWDIENEDNNTANIKDILDKFYISSYNIESKIEKIKSICRLYTINLNIIWFDKYYDIIFKYIMDNYTVISKKYNKYINENTITLKDKSNIIKR